MRIAICEDDRKQRADIRRICETYFQQCGGEWHCAEYADGEALLRDATEETDILFLDIELGDGCDGIAVMKELEQNAHVKKIVFISGHHEGVWDSFGWKTLGFVRKPFKDEELLHWLRVAHRELQPTQQYEFHTEKGIRQIADRDIEALLAEGNYVRVVTEQEHYFVTGTLRHWMSQMQKTDMCQIHRSHAVNLSAVAAVHGEVLMKSGASYPVGRAYRKELLERYRTYILQQTRARL